MKVMIVLNLALLILFVTFSKCHDYQEQQNHNYGVKGRTGHNIKSYGGYFHDTAGHNEAANNFINTQNLYRPPSVPYQFYGWNFNQPARTYGNSLCAFFSGFPSILLLYVFVQCINLYRWS